MKRRKKLLGLDFDGTCTDLEQETGTFREDYLKDVAELMGRKDSDQEFKAMVVAAEARITADPAKYGWTHNGIIVASAAVDPYVFIRAVADDLLARDGFVDPQRNRFLELLFRHHGPHVQSVFKPTALEMLLALDREMVETYVVTNSQPKTVQRKLTRLGENGDSNYLDWLINRVHGSARKYEVDLQFTGVPETLTLPGLERPIHLRRRAYFDVLNTCRLAHALEWSDVVVVGDIFELDLALPFALGATIGLMVNRHTPEYEREFLQNHPRARLLNDPRDILALVRE